ncbi:hypothetical protein SLH46_05545 [Draconibacterium sp. IB214405]|uniref:hypothetical protein n=1 Tax=Draconibacterium sp. IB214405 TaxID=3097352 RepID=UPI002A0D5F8A|nr:hypothetical protein [Draconibacterium sp. IB214405]MDX8338635.1 hypothetical protein [Draconibacterium sp. IB214405]
MKTSKILMILAVASLLFACVKNKNGAPAQTQAESAFNMIKVSEVIQGGSYTYISATENGIAKWIAVSKQEVNPGEVLYYYDALPMENFHSKEIDKTFDVIYFVNKISKTPGTEQPAMSGGMPSSHQGKVAVSDAEVEITKPEGELSISDVYANKADYSSKEFEIRGVVVKVNEQVMGKNWVHIQDGTGNGGNFDLTITTQADVKVGEEVTFKGKLTLEKDFGAGYFYDVIMEDGTLVNKQVAEI